MKRMKALKAFFKNLGGFITGNLWPLQKYYDEQQKEMFSFENQHYTRENYHKEYVTEEDCAFNYVE